MSVNAIKISPLPELSPQARSCRATLPWPGKSGGGRKIVPIFLPFAGCRRRCVFCAQEAQTGVARPLAGADLLKLLDQARIMAESVSRGGKEPVELAFYGGTFTAQPEPYLEECLDFAANMRARGLVDAVRCSTRPDSLNHKILSRLRAAGFGLIELGIQTFDDGALAASGRGYSGEEAARGAKLVREHDFALGIQLLPGLPGQKAAAFTMDVDLALGLGASCLRFYPCLVPEGTALAALWREKRYQPWPLQLALRLLARGLLRANLARVPVIRMGLAPQKGFKILAGPMHPALGGMVQARALLLGALHLAREHNIVPGQGCLWLPARARGFFAGQKNSLLPLWRRLWPAQGQIRFWQREEIGLE